MNQLKKRNLIVPAVAAALIMLFSVGVTPASAISNKIVMEFYFSDANFNNQVGHRTVLRCSGSTTAPLYGTHGQYTKVEEIVCRDWVTLGSACWKVRWGECPVWTSYPYIASVSACKSWAIQVYSAGCS